MPNPECAGAYRVDTVAAVHACDGALTIVFSGGVKVLAPPLLASFVAAGDRMEVPHDLVAGGGPEVRIVRRARRPVRQVYLCTLRYVAAPKLDSRDEYWLRAEVADSQLGIASVRLPAVAVRDYFYTTARTGWETGPTLYESLGVAPSAGPGDIRLSYRVRKIEAEAKLHIGPAVADLRRACNLLLHAETRACYDTLLRDAHAPAVFPYGAVGRLAVAGELSSDRQTFFATRVLSFVPDSRAWRFHVPFRRIEFGREYAVCRDPRRRVEIALASVLPLRWDSTWNQWRHLVGAKLAIEGLFVRTPRYALREGEWRLDEWWTALPAELLVGLSPDTDRQIMEAQSDWRLEGRHADALVGMRARIDRQPVDAEELGRVCRDIGLPGDFDVARISWKPDYDRAYYRQLRRRCRKMYLFRNEYIFDLVGAVAVEVPELGHATYLFQPPESVESFLDRYAAVTKDDIRRNRNGVAEQLGFAGRILHGTNPRSWYSELLRRIGERGHDNVEVRDAAADLHSCF